MIIKTSNLTGPALDWAVSLITNPEWDHSDRLGSVNAMDCPQRNWAQGGPIIEREEIEVVTARAGGWMANLARTKGTFFLGSTPLIAAMRCYVARKLGDTVEVPDELIG